MIRVAAFLTVLLLLVLPQGISAQTPVAPSTNDIQELTRLLADERVQQWLQDQAAGTEPDTNEGGADFRAQVDAIVAQTQDRIRALGQAWTRRGDITDLISDEWRAQVPPPVQVRSLTFVLIFLFLGAGLEWLVRQYTNPVRKRIEVTSYHNARDRIRAAVLRAGLAFLGLVVFALGSVGTFSSFDWPPLLQVLILNALIVIVATRATAALLRLFLAPRVEQLRLVPVSTPVARALSLLLSAGVGLLLLSAAVVDVFSELTREDGIVGQAPEVLGIAVICALLLLFLVLLGTRMCFALVSHGPCVLSPRALRSWQGYLFAISLSVFVLWLLNLTALSWTVTLLGLLFPALGLVTAWVDLAIDRATAEFRARHPAPIAQVEALGDETEAEEVQPDEVIEPYEAYRPIAVRLARFGIIIGVGFALAVAWNVGIFERGDNPSLLQKVFAILIDSAVAILIADLVWTWARTSIDRRLAAYRPPEDGGAPGPEARMATLLPLLRVVLQVTLASMVIMTVLATAGVNIAPILAGASVMGIAIGFGAQSLVKDVVSGIFFLIDDAFRIGEYVEIENLRGTVEKISIRSLQLRHHRGAVHTLPFGELKSLTNHSRDWVIMKLEFRVPFETDLKLVKKLIKQVGAELKANEVYGDGILETLKSQGVRRMEEFNMVVGVKFMTRPGEQWLVRRDAYQGVRDIFEANGIRMAERNVKVEIAGDEPLDDDTRKAASAAAQEAVNQQLPKAPIPDEP